jgi:hypothetical protein
VVQGGGIDAEASRPPVLHTDPAIGLVDRDMADQQLRRVAVDVLDNALVAYVAKEIAKMSGSEAITHLPTHCCGSPRPPR